jgi:hypothetical protein
MRTEYERTQQNQRQEAVKKLPVLGEAAPVRKKAAAKKKAAKKAPAKKKAKSPRSRTQ